MSPLPCLSGLSLLKSLQLSILTHNARFHLCKWCLGSGTETSLLVALACYSCCRHYCRDIPNVFHCTQYLMEQAEGSRQHAVPPILSFHPHSLLLWVGSRQHIGPSVPYRSESSIAITLSFFLMEVVFFQAFLSILKLEQGGMDSKQILICKSP